MSVTNMSAEAEKQLIAEIRACTHCAKDLPLPPRPILQPGRKAPILIVGQAPGRLAHEAGRPFDDPSGDRLRAWLGVSPAQFYDPDCFAMLPMAFCFPGTHSSGRGDAPPPKICATLWRRKLLDALPTFALTLVLGQYAHAWHLGARRGKTLTETVRNYRAFLPDMMPLVHPSPRNNIWLKRNPWFVAEAVPALKDRVQTLLGG